MSSLSSKSRWIKYVLTFSPQAKSSPPCWCPWQSFMSKWGFFLSFSPANKTTFQTKCWRISFLIHSEWKHYSLTALMASVTDQKIHSISSSVFSKYLLQRFKFYFQHFQHFLFHSLPTQMASSTSLTHLKNAWDDQEKLWFGKLHFEYIFLKTNICIYVCSKRQICIHKVIIR